MADYIDRERVLGFLHSCHPTRWEGTLPDGRICHYSDVIDGVAAIPVMTTGWISVKDRLPKPGKDVLVVCSYGWIPNTVYISRYDGTHWYLDGALVQVTYWMPLPAPPKEAQDADDN